MRSWYSKSETSVGAVLMTQMEATYVWIRE